MPKAIHFGKILLVLFVTLLFSANGCAPAKGGKAIIKKNQASKVNASQLGRNKYYFSTNYQKKLSKNFKRR